MSSPAVNYLATPSRISNESLDMLGRPELALGDVSDGSPVAESVRRNYGVLLRGLLRCAHWNFARTRNKLTLLGDATGQSPPEISTIVEPGWCYAYAWPIDGVAARWLPWNQDWQNQYPGSPPQSPPTPSTFQWPPIPMTPGRFLVSSSNQYPAVVGSVPWPDLPDLQRTEGVGWVGRTIILTNCCHAHLVYTRLVTEIELWDPLFRMAFRSLLALILAPIVITDPRERQAKIAELTAMGKNAVADARVANGNDSGSPLSVDRQATWISARSGGWCTGAGDSFGGDGLSGYSYCPWDSSFAWGGAVF